MRMLRDIADMLYTVVHVVEQNRHKQLDEPEYDISGRSLARTRCR